MHEQRVLQRTQTDDGVAPIVTSCAAVPIATEPSAGMRPQRPAHLAPAISASAEALPLEDNSFDAALAIITLHHWRDPAAGLRELPRVARGSVVVLTFDI